MAIQHPDPAAFVPPEYEIFFVEPQDDTPENREIAVQCFFRQWGMFFTTYRIYYDFLMDYVGNYPPHEVDKLPVTVVFLAEQQYITDNLIDEPALRLSSNMKTQLRAAADFVRDYYLRPESPQGAEPVNFAYMKNGAETSMLPKTALRPSNIYVDQMGDATAKDGDFTVTIAKYDELVKGLSPTASALLDCIICRYTESGGRDDVVRMPLDEYMEMRGLSDKQSATEQIKADMRALDRISLTFRDRNKKRSSGFMTINLSGGSYGVKNGIIAYRLNPDFMQLLESYPVIPIPLTMFRVNFHRNPHAYFLQRKIAEHKNLNYGKPNEDTISVKTLLRVCPQLPAYEQVRDSGRRYDQQIRRPFERDMDAITAFRWNYCGKNGAELAPETYAEFEAANVHIEWLNYPKRLNYKQLKSS